MSCILGRSLLLSTRLAGRNFATAIVYLVDKEGNVIDKKTKIAAEQMAKKTNCILVSRTDQKLKYDAYSIIDPRSDSTIYDGEDQTPSSATGKSNTKQREKKRITMGLNISQNDRKVKAKKIMEWLENDIEVEVAVYNQNTSKERFLQFLETFKAELPDVRVLQHVIKDHQLRIKMVADESTRENVSKGTSPSQPTDDEAILKQLLQEEDINEPFLKQNLTKPESR